MPQEVLELIGSRKIRNDLRLISERLITGPEVAMEAEIAVLEQAEASLFATFTDPTYRRTDDLMNSLTQSNAAGAIRRAHWGGRYAKTLPGLEFGTSIWYAKFQRKIGGPSGKPRGRVRVGPNKVLRFTPATRRAAVELVREHVFGHLLGAGL